MLSASLNKTFPPSFEQDYLNPKDIWNDVVDVVVAAVETCFSVFSMSVFMYCIIVLPRHIGIN